ncbi:MAG: hypothetical protein LBV18_06195 [Alistipes sp.]|jgi:signal transduction histidine kinase|nr:hypothetical protein [Alistipes sp.]
MNPSFQHKLIGSFIVIFTLFTVGIVVFEQRSARRYKTEALEERLDAYAGQIEEALSTGVDVDSLLRVMPAALRLTLVAGDGRVTYDNAADVTGMANHADRPEIREATAKGRGSDIRTSESVSRPLLYYARSRGHNGAGVASGNVGVVRVALPYDVEVRSFLKPGNGFLYFVVGLFVVGLAFIFYAGRYLERAVRRLREHEAREKTHRLKREMTGNIAHELRTPVTSIRGFLEIVLGNELDEARRRGYLERAYLQTQTLSELISDMSLLARIDEKQGAFEFSEIDAAELIDKVRSDASKALIEKNITFVRDTPDGLTLRGNRSLVYSVFRNLTDNVIAHAGEGVGIVVSAREEGSRVRFSFSDTGRGIPDGAHLERIFERFYRVNEGRTRDTGGSGLGLSIVKNTIALHGGGIEVRAARPQGLEFVFDLPAASNRR